MRIDKGLPIPEPKISKLKYPFNKLAVGDRLLVEWPKQRGLTRKGHYERVRSAAHTWARNHGRQFSVRKLEEGVGVWRVK